MQQGHGALVAIHPHPSAKRRLRVIYISVVDPRTMETIREILPGECLMAISYWVDEVRLTDNMPL